VAVVRSGSPALSLVDFPALPERVNRLGELAQDLWWTWHPKGRQVFRGLDYRLWRLTSHNPVRMLRHISPEALAQAAHQPEFLSVYDAAIAELDSDRMRTGQSWWGSRFDAASGQLIAYFSAEFAVHQSLPIYAGGLGVLAGDHAKEASDLGLPLVGVGFMYPQGYFHQQMSEDGQHEVYETLNWADAPVELARTPSGGVCVVSVGIEDRALMVRVWQVRLGRVTLYLLDTDLETNAPADRELSARLYGGDRGVRLRQEIVLGVGGVRALRALGLSPAVWHLNEGHAAFVAVERLREAVCLGESFDVALAAVRDTTVFTTHTPVPAGHDAFPHEMVESHLAGCGEGWAQHREAFLALGRHDHGDGVAFSMTALALRTAGRANGVSRRHGEITRQAWMSASGAAAPPAHDIGSITNGVHVPSWVAPDMAQFFERRLGANWLDRHDDPPFWDRLLGAPDEDLWEVRQALRSYLFWFLRERARRLWTERRASAARVAAGGVLLDPNALTIGYARRFTSYKRPELIFQDETRLARILNAINRPVQIVFAGKSHPADEAGKAQLRRVFARALDPRFGGRIAFLEDYDLHVAHFLVQGCDVWLNTPREPLEASGTSGMKAAMNGVPHLSTGDGWWAEGYTGSNGWLIRGGGDRSDPAAVDAADAESLYRLLEESIVPTFFDRDAHGIPRRWLRIVKEAVRTTVPNFSARRMVKQYAEEMYRPPMLEATKHPSEAT
jgi:glycogen phosphorylase